MSLTEPHHYADSKGKSLCCGSRIKKDGTCQMCKELLPTDKETETKKVNGWTMLGNRTAFEIDKDGFITIQMKKAGGGLATVYLTGSNIEAIHKAYCEDGRK